MDTEQIQGFHMKLAYTMSMICLMRSITLGSIKDPTSRMVLSPAWPRRTSPTLPQVREGIAAASCIHSNSAHISRS